MDKSIEALVEDTFRSGNVTSETISDRSDSLSTPFDRLDYLSGVLTHATVLDSRSPLSYEMVSQIIELEKPEITKARQIAEKDGLTGAYNRVVIEQRMETSRKNMYSTLMIDIDKFKHFNDEYGHDVGDIVIKSIVKLIFLNSRESFVGRYGGDEFYVELNKTDKEGAYVAAERIRKAVETQGINYVINEMEDRNMEIPDELRQEKTTITIGIADENQGTNPYNIRLSADFALFNAKKERNKTVIYDSGFSKKA
jgi:diguanylate cyclase (GGDEF)-like protein